MESIQTVLYVDCTKYGAMSQPEINGVGEVVERVLFRNPHGFTFLKRKKR